jgi:hypothetical protein
MSDLVGALVQFSVAEPLFIEDDSDGVRISFYLLLKQLMRAKRREFHTSVVPFVQELVALRLRQGSLSMEIAPHFFNR